MKTNNEVEARRTAFNLLSEKQFNTKLDTLILIQKIAKLQSDIKEKDSIIESLKISLAEKGQNYRHINR